MIKLTTKEKEVTYLVGILIELYLYFWVLTTSCNQCYICLIGVLTTLLTSSISAYYWSLDYNGNQCYICFVGVLTTMVPSATSALLES